MFDDVLIESAGRDRNRRMWGVAIIAIIVHFVLIGALLAARRYQKEKPVAEEKPMPAFVVANNPPPPPPPPPPAATHSAPHPAHVETPREVPHFHQPTEVPREVPQDEPQNTDTAGAQDGGVVGGVQGGQVGGVVGGQIGGQIGGTIGGTLGGQIGGTGTGPVRVGGDVKAPIKISSIEPAYTEPARRARVEGIVILEAIIDANGNVVEVRVLKGLPLGLEDAAVNAVKRWKFQPGTLNGRPVPVYYNLTVNFRLQ